MESLLSSLFQGFSEVVGKLLGHPLDFLAGKSCSSVCGSTWDFTCYIENFCISHLLKLAMVAVLFYLVLLFFYLLYKLGICECVCGTLCRIIWACFATYFSALEYCCTCICHKLRILRRTHKELRRHRREIELYTSTSEEEEDEKYPNKVPKHKKYRRRSLSGTLRDYKGDHLRRSLRPRSHRTRVGISEDSVYLNKRNPIKQGDRGSTVHDIRVVRTSKFAQKGGSYKGALHRRRS